MKLKDIVPDWMLFGIQLRVPMATLKSASVTECVWYYYTVGRDHLVWKF